MTGTLNSFPDNAVAIPTQAIARQKIKIIVQKILLKISMRKNNAIISTTSKIKPCLRCWFAKVPILDLNNGIKQRKGI